MLVSQQLPRPTVKEPRHPTAVEVKLQNLSEGTKDIQPPPPALCCCVTEHIEHGPTLGYYTVHLMLGSLIPRCTLNRAPPPLNNCNVRSGLSGRDYL